MIQKNPEIKKDAISHFFSLPCNNEEIQKKKMYGGVWEIEEEEAEVENVDRANRLVNVPTSLRSTASDSEDVYVAVGKKNSSMDALSWALKHVVKPSTFLYLVHVFPEIHYIPTPLGMLPKSQLTAQQVETFMNQERMKRRDLLQKLLNLCHASKVQVDTLLIESDLVAKAVIELIPVLNIRRLIVGTTKSNMRKLKKGSNAEQIQKSAPDYCKVKIICEGKEVPVTDQMAVSSPISDSTDDKMKYGKQENGSKNSVSCACFSRKFM